MPSGLTQERTDILRCPDIFVVGLWCKTMAGDWPSSFSKAEGIFFLMSLQAPPALTGQVFSGPKLALLNAGSYTFNITDEAWQSGAARTRTVIA